MTTASLPHQLTFDDARRHMKRVGGEGIVNAKDISDFQRATQRVFALMRDLEWHTATQIIEVAGQRQGDRRMREIRQLGYEIERRNAGGREWEYRLTRKEQQS